MSLADEDSSVGIGGRAESGNSLRFSAPVQYVRIKCQAECKKGSSLAAAVLCCLQPLRTCLKARRVELSYGGKKIQ